MLTIDFQDALKAHIAGAAKLQKTGEGSLDEMFKTIVGLRTGEALVFAPDSILDVVNASIGIWHTEVALEQLLDRFVKVRIRNRISTDEGKSIMASDKMEMATPVFVSQPSYPVVDLTGDASAEEEEHHTIVTRSMQPSRRSKRESTPMTRQYSPQTQPVRQTSSPSPALHQPYGSAAMFSKPANQQVAAADVERGLVRTTEAMLRANSKGNLNFGDVRRQVEDDLEIVRGQLSSPVWKASSKEIIKKAAVSCPLFGSLSFSG
jgi:hypothetical protein